MPDSQEDLAAASHPLEALMQVLRAKNWMRICLITSFLPSLDGEQHGGVAVDMLSWRTALTKSAFQVLTITQSTKMPGRRGTEGPHLIGTRAAYTKEKKRPLNAVRFVLDETLNPRTLLRLLRLVKRFAPDCIIVGDTRHLSMAPLIAAKILGVPFYLRYDWICPSYPYDHPCSVTFRLTNCSNCLRVKNRIPIQKVGGALLNVLLTAIFVVKRGFWKSAEGALSVNGFYSKVYYTGYGIPAERVSVVKPWRALPLAAITDPQYVRLRSEKAFKVLYVGRLEPEKGIELLLAAANILPLDAKILFLVAGEGSRRELVEAETKRNPRVRYLGFLNESELSQAYQVASIVVLPSVVLEGHPVVAEEAMAFGKPLIAFAQGGLEEILNGYAKSYKAKPVTPEALSSRLLEAYRELHG